MISFLFPLLLLGLALVGLALVGLALVGLVLVGLVLVGLVLVGLEQTYELPGRPTRYPARHEDATCGIPFDNVRGSNIHQVLMGLLEFSRIAGLDLVIELLEQGQPQGVG